MKTWIALLSMLLAPLAVGCASEKNEETTDVEVVSEGEELSKSGPNAWQHQPVDFDCSIAVGSKFTKSSRRHFYSFPGQGGAKTTFTLGGTWPAALGARIYVTDTSGKVLATQKSYSSSEVSVTYTFPSSGKYFVYVSPVKYQLVQKTYGYKLAASCRGAGCASDADCASDERCTTVVCKALGCKPTSSCEKQPLCAEYTTSDGRFYARNFPAGSLADAQAWLVADPQVSEAGWSVGACIDNNGKLCPDTDPPVCGTPIVTDATSTYASLCEFRKVVREAAGYEGESKGKFTAGACETLACATASVLWEGSDSPVYYVQNVSSKEEEKAFFAQFPEGSTFGSFSGACDQGWMCPALYKPVCGVIRNEPPQTFSNACAFSAAVRSDAGGSRARAPRATSRALVSASWPATTTIRRATTSSRAPSSARPSSSPAARGRLPSSTPAAAAARTCERSP